MPAPRLLPDNDTLLKLASQKTYKEIAATYGVGEQAVYRAMQRINATDERPEYSEIIPFPVAMKHQKAVPHRHLRVLGRIQHNLDVSGGEYKRLQDWLAQRHERNEIVCYDRDMGPNPASPKGGWYYDQRRPEDGDSIVRPPEKPGQLSTRDGRGIKD